MTILPNFTSIPTPSSVENPSLSPLIRCSEDWLAYFRYNRDHLRSLPWNCSYQLTEQERSTIATSIQAFQLGESSEGSHLMRLARQDAARSGDPSYLEALKLFIGEEQRHAGDLGRFMTYQGIALIKRQWTDSIFRKLRRLVNLEVAIVVLLSAELVATVYYQALQTATASPLLQQICDQILYDEAEHVVFQSTKLGCIRQGRSRFWQATAQLLHQLFFSVMLGVVWLDHGKTLQAGGYSFWAFWQESWLAFSRAIHVTKTMPCLST